MTDPAFYRSRSLWLDQLADDPLVPRPPLPGPVDVDVAIVGAGYTGLWTAYYLRRADPGLRVAVLEREVAGFGASGRNGGWCSSFVAMDREGVAGRVGRGAAIALQREMFDTVDEVGRVAGREGIDCHYVKAGALEVVTSPVQLARLEAGIRRARRWGMGADDLRLLGRAEAERRVRVAGLLDAALTPHCAAVHPARLARGLAEVVERLGTPIYESTEATRIRPGRVDTARGAVRAEVVVRATEGYSVTLPGLRRSVLPLYSLMLATEPLPESRLGRDRLGGRGRWPPAATSSPTPSAPATAGWPWAGAAPPTTSGRRSGMATTETAIVHARLEAALAQLPPPAAGARITHRWGGPLGIPATGWHRSASTGPPAWPGPAATSATGWPRPTWPAAPWPT